MCIKYEAKKILKDPENPDNMVVPLTAFTGTAAYNIDGMPLHGALRFPSKITKTYETLNDDKLNTLRAKLHNLKILVIDEISMVSPRIFCYIHGRLQQIHNAKRPEDYFGDVSLLAVGDLYQLKPVRANMICLKDKREELAWELWKQFQRMELSEVMRQKDDATCANLLNHLRTKRKKTD